MNGARNVQGWCGGVRRYTKNILVHQTERMLNVERGLVELYSNLLNLERLKPNKLCHQLDPTGGHCILDIMDTFVLTQHETCHAKRVK